MFMSMSPISGATFISSTLSTSQSESSLNFTASTSSGSSSIYSERLSQSSSVNVDTTGNVSPSSPSVISE